VVNGPIAPVCGVGLLAQKSDHVWVPPFFAKILISHSNHMLLALLDGNFHVPSIELKGILPIDTCTPPKYESCHYPFLKCKDDTTSAGADLSNCKQSSAREAFPLCFYLSAMVVVRRTADFLQA
jgi:hypothetical protein